MAHQPVIGSQPNSPSYGTESHQADRICRGRFNRWSPDDSHRQAVAKSARGRTPKSSRVRLFLSRHRIMATRKPLQRGSARTEHGAREHHFRCHIFYPADRAVSDTAVSLLSLAAVCGRLPGDRVAIAPRPLAAVRTVAMDVTPVVLAV